MQRPAFFVLTLLLSAVVLAGCDSFSAKEDRTRTNSNQTTQAATGAFQARISGSFNQTLNGAVRTMQGSWNGSGFQGMFPFLPCGEEFFEEEGEDYEDDFDFEEECEEELGDSTETFFFLELFPDGENPQEESIFLAYEGEIMPGTYPIAALNLDDTTDTAPQTVFAEYMRYPDENSFEGYTGTSGTLTITSVADGLISGSFSFEATQCFCATEEQMDAFELEIERLEDALDATDPAVFEEAAAAIEALFAQLIIDRPLSVDGDFTDVELSDADALFEDDDDDGDDENGDDDEDGEDDGDDD